MTIVDAAGSAKLAGASSNAVHDTIDFIPVRDAATTRGGSHCAVVVGMNYAPEFAGVGRYTGEIAEHLAHVFDEVVVVTTPAHYPGWRVRKGFRAWWYSAERLNGVEVIRCPLVLREKMSGLWRLIAPLTFAMTATPLVVWQILRRRPSVVMSVVPTLFTAPAVLLASWLVGARTVLHIQDLEVDAAFAVGHLSSWRWLQRIGLSFEKRLLKRFNRIITISERMADRISAKGVSPHRISIVRNWVDLDHIRPMRRKSSYRAELGVDDETFVVQYSGNLGRKQGLNVLLEAAKKLVTAPRIHFVVAGEGPAKEELMTRYGHLPNVTFLPFQPYERLSDFLGLADLHALTQEAQAADLVLPSKLGGMLASGKPIVVTAEEGTELMSFLDGSATVIPPGDVDEMVAAILEESSRPMSADGAAKRCAIATQLSKTVGLDQFARAFVGSRAVAKA